MSSSPPLCSLFSLLYLLTTTPSHIGCFVLRSPSRLTTSMTRAMPTPMTRDSPNGKSSISRPAMGKPMSGTKTNIHIQPMDDFLFFCAAASISGELHLSEKPTGPASPCGGAEDAAWLASIGSGVLKFTALPQPMQNSAPSGNLLSQLGQNISLSLLTSNI